MAKRKLDPDNYVVGPGSEISDIDLDTEEVRYRSKRLTETEAERIAEQTIEDVRRGKPSLEEIRRGRGRPSLSGHSRRSPQVAFRLTAELRAKVEARAKAEGKPVSQVARDALERYLAS